MARSIDAGRAGAETFESRFGVAPERVLATVALAALSVLLLRTWGANSQHILRALASYVPAAILAIAGVWLLTRAYWLLARGQFGVGDLAFVSGFLALPVVALSLELFAALTYLIWDRGLVHGATAGAANLGDTEQLYAWHLVNAVPLLDVTGTLEWERPVALAGAWSGALLLAFKVLLLIPLAGILTAGYETLQSHRIGEVAASLDQSDYQTELVSEPPWLVLLDSLRQLIGYTVIWAFKAVVVVFAVGALFLLVSDSSAWVQSARGVSSWGPTVMHVVGIAVILVLTAWSRFVDRIPEGLSFTTAGGSVLFSLTGVLLRVRGFLLSVLLAVALTVVLLQVGAARTSPALTSGHEVVVPAMNWYAWHLSDVIPFLNIPQTFDWSPPVHFVDPWSRSMLLVLKVDLVLVLFLPVTVIFAMYRELGEIAPDEPTGIGIADDDGGPSRLGGIQA